jgi:hypothetical protein
MWCNSARAALERDDDNRDSIAALIVCSYRAWGCLGPRLDPAHKAAAWG